MQSAKASTELIELDGHGFETGDRVVVRAAEGGTMAAPLVDGTEYFAIRVSPSSFQLALTSGGAAINFSTDGVSMVVAAPLPIDDVILFYSRWVDDLLPGHAVPLPAAPATPVLVTGIVAQLSAAMLLRIAGQVSTTMTDAETAAKAQIERYATGLKLRDAAATGPANLAAVSLVRLAGDPRGWGSGTLP